VRRTGGAAAAAAVALLLAGCSGDDSSADPAVASPEPSASANATTAAECTDPHGDSADPEMDLYDVRLSRTGKDIRVIFDESKPPTDTPLSWVVGFVSADAKHSVQLTAGVKKNGDTEHGITVDDEVTGIDDPVRVTPEGMTTVFPAKPVDALGKGIRWYATLAVDDDEIDFCPGGPELREVLDIVPLTLPAHW
jgi:hypothetical protein